MSAAWRLPEHPTRAWALRLGAAAGLPRRIGLAMLLSLGCAALLVALSGHDPWTALLALLDGAAGSPHRIGVALNRTTPYLLSGAGVALCFRANIINNRKSVV